MCFTRVSASVKMTFAFSYVHVLCHNSCVSHACLHRLKRLLRFSSNRFTMHSFHTRFCIGLNGFLVFLGMVSQCMLFTRFSASITTSFAFSLLWGHNACVSNACRHLLRRLCVFLRIALQCMRLTRVSTSVKTVCAFYLVWRQSKCVSQASLHRFLRFPWYGVKKHVFHTHLYIYLDDIRIFLVMGSQCMRFTRFSASIKTAFAFSSV